jgi:hypothetical protein
MTGELTTEAFMEALDKIAGEWLRPTHIVVPWRNVKIIQRIVLSRRAYRRWRGRMKEIRRPRTAPYTRPHPA